LKTGLFLLLIVQRITETLAASFTLELT